MLFQMFDRKFEGNTLTPRYRTHSFPVVDERQQIPSRCMYLKYSIELHLFAVAYPEIFFHNMSSARKSFKFTTPTPGCARPRKSDLYEEISWPDSTQGPSLTPKDAEAALKDLFDRGTDNFSASSGGTSDASVPGLRKEVKLKLHQVEGRAWMRDREDSAKKRAGGLLADDMGYEFCLYCCLLNSTTSSL